MMKVAKIVLGTKESHTNNLIAKAYEIIMKNTSHIKIANQFYKSVMERQSYIGVESCINYYLFDYDMHLQIVDKNGMPI